MRLLDRYNMEALSESDLQDRLYNYFMKWFDVEFEVTSLCKTKRIDFLMFHKSDSNKLYPIGIELKRTNVKRGGDIAAWCIQANCYTKLIFNGYTPTVFITPQISGWYLDEGARVNKHDIDSSGSRGEHNNVNSFLYKCFNFGELQKYYIDNKAYCRLVINTYQIWDSRTPDTLNIQKLLMCR